MDGHGRKGNSANVFLRNYKLGKTLGIGSFGKVKIAEHVLTGHKVAIKILELRKIKSEGMEEKVRREIKILRLFMHPHIIRLYEVIETPSYIYIVMEYINSGELYDYTVEKGRLSDDEARRFFQQIISGLECCHRNLVVHRDLKPENLLLDSQLNIKIVDFGLSNITRDGHFLKTSCGSPNYAAPEVISSKLYAGPEVDVWSCGVILYAVLCGSHPFEDPSIPILYKKIKSGLYTLPGHLSPGVKDLISRMLVVDPIRRATISEIRQHPWFQANLPHYLAVLPPDTTQEVKKIDEDIVHEVVNLGFDRNLLLESLRNRMQNEGTVSYYLLLDYRLRASNGYLGVGFQELMDGGLPHLHFFHENATSAFTQHPLGPMHNQGTSMRPPYSDDSKWTLGLQSNARPYEIMTEIVKLLRKLLIIWKKIGPYNYKCKWSSTGHPGNDLNNPQPSDPRFGNDFVVIEGGDSRFLPDVVKFEIQLYKTPEEKYLVDLQRVEGPHLLFLSICASLLHQLGVHQ